MIKKIDIPQSTAIDASVLWGGINDNVLAAKINEVIDAVNRLQESQNTYWTDIAEIKKELQTRAENVQPDAESRPENVQDKFAEQRKWIGKICEFWDNDDTQQLSYGVLTKIDTESGFGVQYCCNDEYDYDNCQPVKPDDDIIYKGE